MSITILGLGPGDPQSLTLEARDALAHARDIYLRTREHPTVAGLPKQLRIHSFDRLYDRFSEFDAIYTAIADDIVARGTKHDVLYAVPGHPLFGEISVQKILQRAREKGIPTRVIAGVSFVDAACAALALDPLERGLQVADATDLAQQHFPQLDPDQPALVGQMYNRAVASDCKLTLLVLFPPEHPITLVHAAGNPAQSVESMPLEDLDRSENFGLLTTLYIPPLPRPSSFDALAEIVAHLRSPVGCPWDRAQTHQSLRKDFMEECYEVLETLDDGDIPHLREELGDLLLHILLQAQIAQESGEFLVTDVVAEIGEKLVRRHPHVFGDVLVNGTDEIIANWEQIKQSERGGTPKKQALVPRGYPALAHAQKVARKTKSTADLDDIAGQVKRLGRVRNRELALGEILYALAAYASAKHVDAESALRVAARRKTDRHLKDA